VELVLMKMDHSALPVCSDSGFLPKNRSNLQANQNVFNEARYMKTGAKTFKIGGDLEVNRLFGAMRLTGKGIWGEPKDVDEAGMRIEETARLFDLVENYIRQTIPASEMGKLRNPGGLMPLPESRYGY
jgi:hypothetical protein